MRRFTALLLAMAMMFAFPAQAMASGEESGSSAYGYRTVTYEEVDLTYREQGLIARVTLPYYLGKVTAKLQTRYGEAESEVYVIYAPNDKWDGDCLYGEVSARLTTSGISIYPGTDSVIAWKDLYSYGFLDLIGGLYTFDNDSMQMHFTAGPGLYTGLAAIPYKAGAPDGKSYQEAAQLAAAQGKELSYAATGYNFVLALNDDAVTRFMNGEKLFPMSSYDWPGLKELLLSARYALPDYSSESAEIKFAEKRIYLRGQFLDMPYNRSNWYDAFVASAYNYGLIDGYTDGRFRPENGVSIAECLAMACRMRDIYKGGDGKFTGGKPWYSVFVNYAVRNGIIEAGEFEDYTKPATRAQAAYILYNALSPSAYKALMPGAAAIDVSSAVPYADAITAMLKAGMMSGYADGSFKPGSHISRAEVCVLLARAVNESLRIKPVQK